VLSMIGMAASDDAGILEGRLSGGLRGLDVNPEMSTEVGTRGGNPIIEEIE